MQMVTDAIDIYARNTPDAIAFCAPGREALTYAGLASLLSAARASLNAFGIRRDDAVAIVLPNGPELAAAFLAVASCAAAAPLNPAYRAEEFDFYLRDLRARALIVEAGSESPAVMAARHLGIPILELLAVPDSNAGIFTLRGAPVGPRAADAGSVLPADVALLLHTSGTTSRPKLVPLTHANLLASASNISAALPLVPQDRCLNMNHLFHVHGLIGVIASLTAGASVVCTPGFLSTHFFSWLSEFHPTWYSAVPTVHQAIVDRASKYPEAVAKSSLRFIRSGSSALPRKLITQLEEVFRAPVLEGWGMTEASQQVSNPLPPQVRKPGSVGVATNVKIAIVDDSGLWLESGQIGEVIMRGPGVMHGYVNNPEANRAAFIGGWLRTGDCGYIDADGYLFITGRLKEVINRGGEKISPRELEDVLLDHPAVAQAVVFAVPDATLGEDVGVAVVLRDDVPVRVRELTAFMASRVADFKVPSTVRIVDEIPMGVTGKPQRIGLAATLGITAPDRVPPQSNRGFTGPRTGMEWLLAKIWTDVLQRQVSIHAHFLDAGGDSMLAGKVIARLRDRLALELPVRILFEAPSIAQQAQVIEAMLLDGRLSVRSTARVSTVTHQG